MERDKQLLVTELVILLQGKEQQLMAGRPSATLFPSKFVILEIYGIYQYTTEKFPNILTTFIATTPPSIDFFHFCNVFFNCAYAYSIATINEDGQRPLFSREEV